MYVAVRPRTKRRGGSHREPQGATGRIGQIHVPEKRRIEAVRMAVRIAGKDVTLEQILSDAQDLTNFYKDGTLPSEMKGQ